MGETNKQVRVDNWGIFFLQRLQLFFNRTDYCDLTLQFEGNVQLKVHRLVMNACTEYFNILEQTCEVVDGNTIIMPEDLQADVILPIVNFMYTGMLEFQMSIFDKLYRTADVMNIPILTKLLDAQRKPIPPQPRSQNKKSPSTWNLHGKKVMPRVENDLPGRKMPVWKRKNTPVSSPATPTTQYYSEPKKVAQDPLAIFDNTPKPTRFEWPEDEINTTFNLMENSFDDISYTSKPLLTQDDELRASTSFEDMKYGPSSNRKSKEYNQSIDMEEVKSYVKEQKIRSDMVEYEDEDDPDNFLESPSPDKDNNKRKAAAPVSPVHTKKVRFSVNEKENKEAKINITATGRTQEMDHTKIISEVLKKYPQLVKKNKNIRLKILAKTPTKMESPKVNQNVKIPTSKVKVQVASPKGSPRIATNVPSTTKANAVDIGKNPEEGPWVCNKCISNDEPVEFVLYYLYRKHMTDVHHEKFDSRMCKFCGHQSSKHNMLMYHQYTKHGIKPPPAYNFPKCNRCPYIALTENLLIKHKLNHTKFEIQCTECKVAFNSQASLSSHIQITGHTGKSGRHNYDCQYCTKRAGSGNNLFSHIKLVHREEARRDGIVSIDEIEDEQMEDETEDYILPAPEEHKEKIKILSDIKVPASSGETTDRVADQTTSTSQERVTTGSGMENVAGGIATSLGLVDIVVLDENQQYILHNDQQLVTQQDLRNEQQEYIIPEISEQHTFAQGQSINEVITSEHSVITQSILNNSDIASTDELVMVLTDHDYNDGNNEILSNENSNIVVLYSHPVDGQQNQFITSQGNLMLNSQTGMLEIRNNDSHSIDNSQDAQIESIEMIQREINSHNIMGTHAESAVSTDQGFDHPLEENTVLLDNQYASNTCVIETKEPEQEVPATEEIDVDRMISLNDKNANVDDDMPQHVLVLNDCLESQQEEPMEIDEECTVQDNQNENQNVPQEALTNETESVTAPVEAQETVMSKSMPSIDDTVEVTESEGQTGVVPTEQETTEDVSEEAGNLVEGNKDEPAVEEASATVEAEPEVADQPTGECTQTEVVTDSETEKIEHTNADMETQQPVEITSEEVGEKRAIEDSAVTTAEEQEVASENENIQNVEVDQVVTQTQVDSVQEEAPREPTEVEEPNPPEIVATEENNAVATNLHAETEVTHDVTEEPSVDNSVSEEHPLLHEENASGDHHEHVTEEVTEHVEEIVQHVEEMVETEEIVSDNKNETDQTVEQGQTQDVVTEAVDAHTETETQPQMEVQSHEEIHTEMEESQVEESSSFMEINLQTEEVSLQTAETPSQIDENSVQNESADETSKDCKFHEETSQTGDKITMEEQMMEDVSSVGENSQSQDSQTSQCSSKQEEIIREFKKTTSQATKISILNDWEDTEDSQQSDQVSKKAELTVNKLIHDWDDDDEEGHESDS